jgi:hypothetical protein
LLQTIGKAATGSNVGYYCCSGLVNLFRAIFADIGKLTLSLFTMDNGRIISIQKTESIIIHQTPSQHRYYKRGNRTGLTINPCGSPTAVNNTLNSISDITVLHIVVSDPYKLHILVQITVM